MGLIYLIRHGETEGNARHIFRGKMDLPLNENGHQEARHNAELLTNSKISKIYTSPLTRARETAQPIADLLRVSSVPDEGFNDIDVGLWQGLEISEAEKKHAGLFMIWRNSPELFKFPQGESLEELKLKSYARLLEVAKQHENESIAVVTHQIVNRILLLTALGQDLSHYWQISQNTAAINVLEYNNGRFIIHAMNIGYQL
jgi:broad specificity phosphatase PhoE